MSRPRCDRIPTDGPQPGLNTALAGLLAALPTGQLPAAPPPAPGHAASPPQRRRLVMRREKAQRGGRTVIVIDGFAPGTDAEEIAALARRLRKACGCGGTVRGLAIEVQGDQPERVRTLLEAEGFLVAGLRPAEGRR